MPYIKRADYQRAFLLPDTPGELNYAITRRAIAHMEGGPLTQFYHETLGICESYITRQGTCYRVLNEVIGVLACAGIELLRRCGDKQGMAVDRITDMLADVGQHVYGGIAAPYEDVKIRENGDVYPAALVD